VRSRVGLSAVSVGLVVESGRAIDFPSWSVSSRVLWVSEITERGFWASPTFFASGGRYVAVFVRVCRHGSFVESLLSFDLDLSRSILIWLAESRSIGGVLSALGRGVTRVPPPLAVRCLVFSGFVGVACFSSRN
jgi:hypothetical protein